MVAHLQPCVVLLPQGVLGGVELGQGTAVDDFLPTIRQRDLALVAAVLAFFKLCHKNTPPGYTCQSLPGGDIIRIVVGRIIAFRQADLFQTLSVLQHRGRFFFSFTMIQKDGTSFLANQDISGRQMGDV